MNWQKSRKGDYEYEYDVHAYNVMNIHSCVFKKHTRVDLPEVVEKRRQKDVQAKATKHLSDKLFLRKEAEARAAKCHAV